MKVENIQPLEKMIDYTEVFNSDSKCVILGLHADISKYKKGTNFIGIIFNPERRKERWSYRKNIAFFTAALDLKKTMILVSDINKIYDDESSRMNKKGRKKIIIDEILWMDDNNYQFSKVDNIIVCKPSKCSCNTIVNYRHFSYTYRLNRLTSIIKKISKYN